MVFKISPFQKYLFVHTALTDELICIDVLQDKTRQVLTVH